MNIQFSRQATSFFQSPSFIKNQDKKIWGLVCFILINLTIGYTLWKQFSKKVKAQNLNGPTKSTISTTKISSFNKKKGLSLEKEKAKRLDFDKKKQAVHQDSTLKAVFAKKKISKMIQEGTLKNGLLNGKGKKIVPGSKSDEETTFIGTFKKGSLVEGEVIYKEQGKKQRIEQGTFDKQGRLLKGKRMLPLMQKNEEGLFSKGELVEGTISRYYKKYKTTWEGKFTSVLNNRLGEYKSVLTKGKFTSHYGYKEEGKFNQHGALIKGKIIEPKGKVTIVS